MDLKTKNYLEKQGKKQQEIIEKIRKLILSNFPDLNETVMSEGLWYEGKFYIASFKDHVNLGAGISGLTKEEINLFEGKGKTMRHLKFYGIEDINEKELLNLMRIVYEKTKCSCGINWRS